MQIDLSIHAYRLTAHGRHWHFSHPFTAVLFAAQEPGLIESDIYISGRQQLDDQEKMDLLKRALEFQANGGRLRAA